MGRQERRRAEREARKRDARFTAVWDQARAACAEASAIAKVMAGVIKPERSSSLTVGSMGWLHRRMQSAVADHLSNGEAILCPHIGSSPNAAVCFAFDPGHFWCRACAVSIEQRITDEPEDNTCDRCREVDYGGMHPFVQALPATVLADADLQVLATGPAVVVCGGLCRRCHGLAVAEAGREPATPAGGAR